MTTLAQQWQGAMSVNEQAWVEMAYDAMLADRVLGVPLPQRRALVFGYGFPKGRGRAGSAAGATYVRALTDGRTVILIHPREWTSAKNVLAKVLHQALHAAYPRDRSHGGLFGQWAGSLGFVEPFAGAEPGPALLSRFASIIATLPPFPASSFDLSTFSTAATRNELYTCACHPPIKIRHAGRRIDHLTSQHGVRCERCAQLFELYIPPQ